ncbi:MAG: hypothetical protein HQL51_03230 [Magnetococcales bacterium]|nr:hypothetical protein [Magnetococcales bacterium]
MGIIRRERKHKSPTPFCQSAVTSNKTSSVRVVDLREQTWTPTEAECVWVVEGYRAVCIPPDGKAPHIPMNNLGASLWVDTDPLTPSGRVH